MEQQMMRQEQDHAIVLYNAGNAPIRQLPRGPTGGRARRPMPKENWKAVQCKAKGRHLCPPKYCTELTYAAAAEPPWNWYCSLDQKLSSEEIYEHINITGPDSWALGHGKSKMQKGWTMICMQCGGELTTRDAGRWYLDVANVNVMAHWNKVMCEYLMIIPVDKDDEDWVLPGPAVIMPRPVVPGPPTQAPPHPPPPPPPPHGSCVVERESPYTTSTR